MPLYNACRMQSTLLPLISGLCTVVFPSVSRSKPLTIPKMHTDNAVQQLRKRKENCNVASMLSPNLVAKKTLL